MINYQQYYKGMNIECTKNAVLSNNFKYYNEWYKNMCE